MTTTATQKPSKTLTANVNAGPVNAKPAVPARLAETDNALAVALVKILTNETMQDSILEGRNKLTVGDHKFNGQFVVTLNGVLRKGKDFKQNISNKIDWMLAFAVVSSMLNETSMKHAMRIINAAHRSKKNHPEKTVELMDRVKTEVEAKIEWLKKSTERPMDGKTTLPEMSVTIEEV